ncbi:MAG TPA: type IX secretion system plug protein domain-containing protein [Chryseolinea sp.]|nr:type IX secretion system plug protein domain-containing protein [Chryseolinea sp.]
MKHILLIFAFAMAACTPIVQSSVNSESNPKALKLIDLGYEPEIKTIQLYPENAPTEPAVTSFGKWNLLLQFDDLRNQRDTYYAKVIHCNYDWTKSDLQDLDFMTLYNEFPITNNEFSVDTHIPYVHYWFAVPPVKLPGNYVLMVYRGSDKEDIILTKRFMVYTNQVAFTRDGNLIGAGNVADLSQQLNFTVDYKNLTILNPLLDVHVNIYQNHRWDNMIQDVKPSFVREIEKELEYRFFEESKMFRGGSEFRFFDLRSINNPGRNIATVTKNVKPFEAYVVKDKSRAIEAYSQYDDLNGGFNIDNYDYRDLAFTNYVNVNFSLASPDINGDVYVAGAFNNWNLNQQNKMQYDSVQRVYTARILLKQGWYDYQYVVKSPTLPYDYFEGSHFETENYYEVFVYHKPYQPRADLLIGYLRIDKNPR